MSALGTRIEPAPAWFKNPEMIPAEEMAAAKAALSADDPDEKTFEWRMQYYTNLRVGYSWATRQYLPHFVTEHDEAVVWVKANCKCLHLYERDRDYSFKNPVLGTGEAGYINVCTKCGDEKHVATWKNNWSGD